MSDCKVERQSEVSEQMVDIDNSLNSLVDILTGLRERLSGILRQPDSKPEGDTGDQTALCNHAEQLRGYNKRIRQILSNLSDLKVEIEL